VSYYDHTYFNSLFGEFIYPDGTKPQWEAIDCLQKLFMKFFNKLRTKQILTFPVETMAMVYDPKTNDIIDKDYKDFTAEMYAEGHSFFTYISDSADSLASCCRLRNELAENTFNPTSGLTGVMTGSCNVITLNINRIVQDWFKNTTFNTSSKFTDSNIKDSLANYIINILERVYKYHIAFKTMLYDLEDKGMFAASNGGYIHISKLYSTIGINGLNEAARFLGLEVGNNPEYIEFLQLILGTIKEENKKHSIHDKKRPFLFNSEVVPAEGLGGKNYNWDKEDGYWVPDDENLYNSYFYDAHDDTSVLDKFILHGRQTYQFTDGGSAAHINLEDHLSKEQYLKLIDFAIANGTNYFTFNIPNSKCDDCGYITKHPITECPKCHSHNITQYTRVIGYLRPVKSFGKDRQIEASKRHYSNGVNW
jgi:ribonucleoside-triphosphate reductase